MYIHIYVHISYIYDDDDHDTCSAPKVGTSFPVLKIHISDILVFCEYNLEAPWLR